MKRIALVYAPLLLCSLALTAADTPAPGWTPQAALSQPASCNVRPAPQVGIPEPMPKGYLPPPCIAWTECPGSEPIYCPVSEYYGCSWSDGCWANCGEYIMYCPGAQQNPDCMVS